MLLVIQLERVFIFKDKGQDIKLIDFELCWSVEVVLNFYVNMYFILIMVKVFVFIICDDRIEYKLESVMGIKG